MNNLDFCLGYSLGKINLSYNTAPFKEKNINKSFSLNPHKVIKYIYMKELDNVYANLEDSYKMYKDKRMITIVKNNHIYYFLEVEVNKNDLKWGEYNLLDKI